MSANTKTSQKSGNSKSESTNTNTLAPTQTVHVTQTSGPQKSGNFLTTLIKKILTSIGIVAITALITTECILDYFSIRYPSSPNWIGFTYQPSDSHGNYAIFNDNVILKTHKNGIANASFKKGEDKSDNLWVAKGYVNNGVMSMSYVADDDKNKGIGTFYLARLDNENEYRGHQMSFDCDAHEVLVCPYILVPANATNVMKDADHISYLNQGCEKVKQPPPANVCT